MRYIVLINFVNYIFNIFCNNKGVIILILIFNKIKDISRRVNIITKKRETFFDSKYCTLYKKSDSELLYKYTDYEPDNSFKKQIVNTYIHEIPLEKELSFPWTRKEYLLRNYHYRKSKKLREKYDSYYQKHFY